MLLMVTCISSFSFSNTTLFLSLFSQCTFIFLFTNFGVYCHFISFSFLTFLILFLVLVSISFQFFTFLPYPIFRRMHNSFSVSFCFIVVSITHCFWHSFYKSVCRISFIAFPFASHNIFLIFHFPFLFHFTPFIYLFTVLFLQTYLLDVFNVFQQTNWAPSQRQHRNIGFFSRVTLPMNV